MTNEMKDQVLSLYDRYAGSALSMTPDIKKQAAMMYSELSKIMTAEERMWLNLSCAIAMTGKHVDGFKQICAKVRSNLIERMEME